MSPTPTPPNPQNLVDKNENNLTENVINGEELDNETMNSNANSGDYQMLHQTQQEHHYEDDDDDDDDDEEYSEDDDSESYDPDLDFEQLAVTRAFIQQSENPKKENLENPGQQTVESNANLFEIDFFERKIKLECEEIVLDENKTKEITKIMSNFKLDEKFIPNWAKLVPENIWKKNLIESLNAKKTDLFENRKEEETSN